MSKKSTAKKSIQSPVACPKCASTKFFTNIPGSKEITRSISGSFESFRYSAVSWKRKRCSECRQVFSQRTYSA